MDESLKVIDYIKEAGEYVKTPDGSISASQMLYMLGIYESTLKAISSLDILALLLSCWRDSWNISHSPYSGTADQKAQGRHIFNNIRLYAGIIAVTAARTFNRRKPVGRCGSVGAGFCKSLFLSAK